MRNSTILFTALFCVLIVTLGGCSIAKLERSLADIESEFHAVEKARNTGSITALTTKEEALKALKWDVVMLDITFKIEMAKVLLGQARSGKKTFRDIEDPLLSFAASPDKKITDVIAEILLATKEKLNHLKACVSR